MRTYHPASWSQQAREFANKIYIQVIEMYEKGKTAEYYDLDGNYHGDVDPEEWGIHIFQFSYRHPLIRTRAAGIFGRKIRKYKIKKKVAN